MIPAEPDWLDEAPPVDARPVVPSGVSSTELLALARLVTAVVLRELERARWGRARTPSAATVALRAVLEAAQIAEAQPGGLLPESAVEGEILRALEDPLRRLPGWLNVPRAAIEMALAGER